MMMQNEDHDDDDLLAEVARHHTCVALTKPQIQNNMASSFDCTTLVDPALIEYCEVTVAANTATMDAIAEQQSGVDSFFVIWGSSLVFMMHLGFAMLSAGAIRGKNNKNILLSIVMDLTVCALGWFFLGYGLAFGEDHGLFIGGSNFVGFDIEDMAFWLFQFCFAATSATIVSGAIAERARFETYLLTSGFISLWVYPVVVHWVWGGGFLALGSSTSVMSTGVIDFAGCGPVHMVGGVAGAVASKVMGPRVGRFDPATGKALPIPGHSAPLATLGTFVLWVGWIGFNCASALALGGGGGAVAARAGVMTILCSSAAALSAMFLTYLLSGCKEFDLTACLNGALGGLVSITGCCGFVEMWAAIVIGLIGGLVYVGSSRFTLNVLKIDDPLDATPVHLFCGMWGILAGAFFANPVLLEGLFAPDESDPLSYAEVPSGVVYGGNTYKTIWANGSITDGGNTQGALVATAFVEIAVVLAWVGGWTLPWFLFWNHLGLLRITSDVETDGIDASSHGGSAYPENFYPQSKEIAA